MTAVTWWLCGRGRFFISAGLTPGAAGGVCIILGGRLGEGLGTVMLTAFLAGVTFVMHAPTHSGPGALERNFNELVHMLKNGAILGGLLVLWSSSPGNAGHEPRPPVAGDKKTR